MYSIKPLSAGDPITYDFSPQLELLKSSKVVRKHQSCFHLVIIAAALHVRRHQLQTHLGQFSENSWTTAVHSMSGTSSSGKSPNLKLDRSMSELIFRQELREQLHCTLSWQHQCAGELLGVYLS